MNSPPTITTIDQLNALLNRHPYLRDRPSFPKHYWHAQCYLLLKHAQNTHTLPTTSIRQLAHRANLSEATISQWLNDNRFPVLLHSLQIHEHARCTHEQHLPHEHHHYRIDPSTVYNTLRPLRTQPHTPEHIATALTTLYKKVETKRFLIADLKTYHEAGPRWTRTIAKSIEKHREEIESILNQRLSLNNLPHTRIRIGIHDHTLYIYHYHMNPENWLTRLRYEHFYFDTTEIKSLLINDAKRHLNTTKIGLSRLTLQLTNHKGELTNRTSRLGDFSRLRTYLTGEALKLLLDTTGCDFKDIQLFITRLGRDTHGFEIGGIHNPIFLEGKDRDEIIARLLGIAFSDGHIHHEKKQFTYIEKDADRRHYVKNLMKVFGDVYITEEKTSSVHRLNMPVTIGRLLEQYGVPAGDKHLSPNFRLPEMIRNGSDKIKCAYLSEVIPEDGYFDTHGRAKFGIKRAQVLDAGPKTEIYDFQSKIPPKTHQFIKQHGETRTQQIRDEPPRKETILVYGKITELTHSEDTQTSQTAQNLLQIIHQNPCQLLEDEFALIASLGINMHKTPKEIHVQENNRTSMIWEMYTLDETDARKWAQLALPSSNPKRKMVMDWLGIQASLKDTTV